MIDDAVMEQYRALTRHIRNLITEEIREGNYQHLRNPKTRNVSSNVHISNFKARPSILVRPPDMEKTGNRNLDVGDLEIAIVIIAELKDKHDYATGLSAKEDLGKFSIGHLLRHGGYILGAIQTDFSYTGYVAIENLGAGRYNAFVKNILFTLNYHVGQYKEIYSLANDAIHGRNRFRD
ncbi:hypothetical protein JXA85_03090 [Candidatus Woesearchaeota archaeon]|nr:hypothetical protein [Candidatus Woesearchaeota archaeon]